MIAIHSRPWRSVLATIGFVALVLTAAGCGGSASSSNQGVSSRAGFYSGVTPGGTPVRGGTVVVDTAEGPTSFNPLTGPGQGQPAPQVFDQLFELMPGATESKPVLKPALVSSWTVSPNGLVYTFHIKQGIRFSNGMPLTGEDVVFSLQQDEAPTSGVTFYTKTWKSVSLVGPMTVRLQLKQPEAAMLESLDENKFSIVPKSVFLKEGPKGFGLHPIGTGPYMLQSATPGFTKMTLVPNPHYWQSGKPYLQKLVYNIVESENSRILAVRSGAATMATGIPYAQVASLKATQGVKMLVGPEWGASNNLFNRAKKPFDNVDVRKALLYATPRESIIKSVYKGLGTPANSLWGELQYWSAKVPLFPYDIAKARELLKASTVPNGFDLTIQVPSGETQGELLASVLQSAWAQIGVHAKIEPVQLSALYSNFFSGKFEFVILPPEAGYYTYFAPDGAAAWVLNNPEAGGYSPPANSTILKKLAQAMAARSERDRSKLFGEVQYESYWQEAQLMPLVNLVSLNLVSDQLRGFQVLPSRSIRFELAWLAK